MNGVAQWFGSDGRPLFGWVHRSDAAAVRAAIVICPSIGQEEGFTHYAMVDLANRLADEGFLVVRFDYDATGDSMGGLDEPDRVAAWLESISTAVEFAREHTSAPVTLVGMRLGALLASEAAKQVSDVHGLVLWDSPRSGGSFVREQRVRQTTSLGDSSAPAGGLTALGLTLSRQSVEDLATLDLRASSELACHIALCVDRPGYHPLGRQALTRSGGSPERIEAPDQDEFLYRQTTPDATLAAVIGWLSEQYPDDQRFAVVGPSSGLGRELRLDRATERAVEIGPHRLFGIVTEPDELRSSTTVVFVPEFYTPHVGLSRNWTDLAREWAALGVRSLRFDISGCGDSPPRPGAAGHRLGLVEHIEDTIAALTHANPANPSDTLVIGLCSGAYLGLEAAMEVRPRGIAVINPSFSLISAEYPLSPRRQAAQRTRPVINRLFGKQAGRIGKRLSKPEYAPILTLDPSFNWERSFEACYWQNYLYRRARWLPDGAWSLINRIMVKQRPEETFRQLGERGTDVLFLAGDPDWGKTTLGSKRALRKMERQGRLHLRHDPQLDHAVMRPGVKTTVMDVLSQHVRWLLREDLATQPPVGAAVEQERMHGLGA